VSITSVHADITKKGKQLTLPRLDLRGLDTTEMTRNILDISFPLGIVPNLSPESTRLLKVD
jgi:hypothetical protein